MKSVNHWEMKTKEPEIVFKSIPYKIIKYSGRDYIVIPYEQPYCCLCITGNCIMGLEEMEKWLIYEERKILIIKTELREIFTKRIMNGKYDLEILDESDKKFYNEVFNEAYKLNDYFLGSYNMNGLRNELINTIYEGILRNNLDNDILKRKMYELSGKQYYYNCKKILCNDTLASIYQFCQDVYEYGGRKNGII